jgi:SNF2 family DNA or RNA helicase
MSAPTLKQCLQALASASPDGATYKNGIGFNRNDAPWLMKMAASTVPEFEWTPRQRFFVYQMLIKYTKQLAAFGLDFTLVKKPEDVVNVKTAGQQVAATIVKSISLTDTGKFALVFGYNAELIDRVKKWIPFQYRTWVGDKKRWEVDLRKAEGRTVADFQNFLSSEGFLPPADVKAAIQHLLTQARLLEIEREAAFTKSFATDAKLEIPGFPVEQMRGFQKAGVVYALEKKRCFIADEMGLGKSIQSIATVEHDKAYPAIFVCKAALRLNWVNEFKKWLPERKVTMVPSDMVYGIWEILIISYEGLVKWYDTLESIEWKAIVLDESQLIKHAKAKRTIAARDLAKFSKAPIRLCLTGTPIDICPYEFSPQIQFLGLMEALGGSSYFYQYFCNADTRGAGNMPELNSKLRKIGYIRREKKDVLTELPPKQRSIQMLEIDNMTEYKKAESDFIAWLKGEVQRNPDAFQSDDGEDDQTIEQKADKVANKAQAAEQIVQLNHLKRLAMRGMLENAKAWIEDFIESGQKLIVFCHHIEAQRQVYELFKDVAVWTRASAGPQVAVDTFQKNPRVKVIVCSLMADNAGHTLTAASNVVFLELGWTPTIHEQATDRAHRIGQRDSVTAWYLIAKGTIYERIIALIDSRRSVVEAATSGTNGKMGKSITSELFKQLTA